MNYDEAMLRTCHKQSLLLIAASCLAWHCAAARSAEDVTFKQSGKVNHVIGKTIVTAQDGGILLLTPDGKLWTIMPDEVVEHHEDDKPATPLTSDELKKRVLSELPAGFETYGTVHYLIFHNTSRAYAQWCGALFERLYSTFQNFWTRRGFKLHEPATPLVVVIYADRAAFSSQSASELGNRANGVIGYYSLQTNWVKMYDLTGVESLRPQGEKRLDAGAIGQLLSRPEATTMVSTVIHEATHQIAFNCGLQQRLADIPLWVCEGLAEYFETPNPNYGKGWKTVGELNPPRIERFNQYLSRRPGDSLTRLIVDDNRFRAPDQALDAYAEAWALNYFLLRQHAKEYQKYLDLLAEKGPLLSDSPDVRLKEFKDCFGQDLGALDAEFVKYMARVK